MTDLAHQAAQLEHQIAATHRHGAQLAGEISRLRRVLRALVAVNARRRAQLSRLLSQRPRRVSLAGVDYAWGGPISGAWLAAHGYRFAARYLSHDPSKDLSRAEALDHTRHGIASVAVWETTATRAQDGAAAGQEDALAARAQLVRLGAPPDTVVFFAVDEQINPKLIVPYFVGARSTLGPGGVGVYGGYDTVRALLNLGLVAKAWQTYAWSDGRWDDRAVIRQVRNGIRVAGVDSDLDTAAWSDFGGFTVK